MKAQIESLRLKKSALHGTENGFHKWILDLIVDEVGESTPFYLDNLEENRNVSLLKRGWSTFKNGDKIKFIGDEFIVIKNYGLCGRVVEPHSNKIIDPFYWEYECEKCRLVK